MILHSTRLKGDVRSSKLNLVGPMLDLVGPDAKLFGPFFTKSQDTSEQRLGSLVRVQKDP